MSPGYDSGGRTLGHLRSRLCRPGYPSPIVPMPGSLFPTTRRSVVLALASDDAAERTRAFDALVAIYWQPLYKYVRIAHRTDDVGDLTQSFLTRALEKNALAGYDAEKASFRTFLRTLFDRHVANEQK